jgi:predicted CXXCH cytochrome family protein
MKKILVVVTVLAIALVSSVAMAGISTTKHNLAQNGSGGFTSNITEICVFCHTPHNAKVAQGPLWNRSAVDRNYTMYVIQTAPAQTMAPNGLSMASKGCMSCHDGATGLNQLVNLPGTGTAVTVYQGGSVVTNLSGFANIGNTAGGTDLSNDHPVAAIYDPTKASLRALDNSGAGMVTKLVGTGIVKGLTNSLVQCESCHDVHTSVASFLRLSNSGSALCLACHNK